MIRAALILLALAGCATAPPSVEQTTPYELIRDPNGHVIYQPCGNGHQCATVRQGNELLIMGHPSRIGDDDDVWNMRATTVQAISLEDE